MNRHALSPLFDPRSLVVIDAPGAGLAPEPTLPPRLAQATTRLRVGEGDTVALPATLQGVSPGARPDLALLRVGPDWLSPALAALTAHPPRAVIVYTRDAPHYTAAMCRAWAEANDCVLVGPMAFGIQRPHIGFNASLHPHVARAGKVAVVAQSRAILSAIMDWADDTRTGFSAAIEPGTAGVIQLPAILDFLASDPYTDSIVLYLEYIDQAREFMSALRGAASAKPVIVLKAARGRLPGAELPADTVVDAALRRAGALRVHFFVQLFSTIKALGPLNRPRGQRLALFTNGRGQARLAVDAIEQQPNTVLATLTRETRELLAQSLSSQADVSQPVVEHGTLDGPRITQALQHLVADSGVDGVLVLLTPDPDNDIAGITTALCQVVPTSRKPIIVSYMGDASVRGLRQQLAEQGVPSFRTPETAIDAFGQLMRYHYNQQLALQMQPPEPLAEVPDLTKAHRFVDRTPCGDVPVPLADADAHALLAHFRVPLVSAGAAPAPEDATWVRVRVQRDARFGPVVTLGSPDGWRDPSSAGVELVPLNGFLARRLMERSPAWGRGQLRHASTAALDALEDLLVALSDLAVALPVVQSVDLARVRITDSGVLVHEAEVIRLPLVAATQHQAHLAIAPYPRQWVRSLSFPDGSPWTLRPIRPEDAEPLQDFIRDLSEHSRYMRFISAMRELPPRMLARYTQIDYHRELALIATVQQPDPRHRGHPREMIVGLAHYLRNADGVSAEYALVIADGWQRRRLGPVLMQALIEAAREQSLDVLEGAVLATNKPMLRLMTQLGFVNDPYPDDPSMRHVWLPLTSTT